MKLHPVPHCSHYHPPLRGKIVFTKLVPGAKKVRDHWSKGLYNQFAAIMMSNVEFAVLSPSAGLVTTWLWDFQQFHEFCSPRRWGNKASRADDF